NSNRHQKMGMELVVQRFPGQFVAAQTTIDQQPIGLRRPRAGLGDLPRRPGDPRRLGLYSARVAIRRRGFQPVNAVASVPAHAVPLAPRALFRLNRDHNEVALTCDAGFKNATRLGRWAARQARHECDEPRRTTNAQMPSKAGTETITTRGESAPKAQAK